MQRVYFVVLNKIINSSANWNGINIRIVHLNNEHDL